MRFPTLYQNASSREMVELFKGYNHNLRIGEGEFFDMTNMTSDGYPVLSPRKKRGVYAAPEAPTGLICKDSLCYTDGTDFVMNEYRVDLGLSAEPKQLVSMGAYVIILPDKKWINTLDLTQWGNIDASFESTADVSFQLCNITGELYEGTTVAPSEPKEPEDLDLWIDTSAVPHTLKQYSAASAVWVSIATTYIRIGSAGIGKAFEQYDGVTVSGIVLGGLEELNGSTVIWEKGDDYIVVVGMLDTAATQGAERGAVQVRRQMPNMDFVVESENRLWGCRYGTAQNGEVVNEIYASKLGDFKNWNCFMNLSTDSYAVSCGTDGPFTGAVTHLGFPLFFKENCVHKVYGSYPANFQIQTTACRGVQRGCSKSLAIVNETLFYKARSGICAYDGSLPEEAAYALGGQVYSEAVGGAHGNKYYVSMKDTEENWHLFVYDMAKGMWHREDDLQAASFCSCRGDLYAIDARNKGIITMLGSGTQSTERVKWMVETGELGISSPDRKYLSRLTVRLSMEIGAVVELYARYDLDESWTHVGTVRGTSLQSFSLPIRPRRCDFMRLRIEGEGVVKIYSITKTIEEGSELP